MIQLVSKKYLLYSLCLCILSLCNLYGQNDKPEKQKKNWEKVFKEAQRSVVQIEFAGTSREDGSGVVIAIDKIGDAYVLTAHHVVSGYDNVKINYYGYLSTGDSGTVMKEYFSETDDIAIVKINRPSVKLKPVNFCKKVPKEGSYVGTIGHPQGYAFSWTDGSIEYRYGKYIHHSARLQPGNSGGPLLDRFSRMAGMNAEVIYADTLKVKGDDGQIQKTIILKPGGSVTLASGIIVATLDNWFKDDKTLKHNWKEKRYGSYWRSPGFYIPAAAVVVGSALTYLLWPGKSDPATFGEPPMPPDY